MAMRPSVYFRSRRASLRRSPICSPYRLRMTAYGAADNRSRTHLRGFRLT
jgi:hypothetical protein